MQLLRLGKTNIVAAVRADSEKVTTLHRSPFRSRTRGRVRRAVNERTANDINIR